MAETIKKLLKVELQSVQPREVITGAKNVSPLILQYRGTISDKFSYRLRRILRVPIVFTTRKLRAAMPSLKSPVPKELNSHVVYQLFCPSCDASYVGQTIRHLSTRLNEHRRPTSPVGEHLQYCHGASEIMNYRILSKCTNSSKLLTMEALHIAQKKPGLNTREEYRHRELTIRL